MMFTSFLAVLAYGLFVGYAVGRLTERNKWICAMCDDFELECNGNCGRLPRG